MSLPLRSFSLGEDDLCQITTREKMNSKPNRGWGVQKGWKSWWGDFADPVCCVGFT